MANRPFTNDEFDKFAIDEDGRLVWNGETVLLEKRVKLETYQVVLASLATFGAVLSGIHPFLVSWHIFGF